MEIKKLFKENVLLISIFILFIVTRFFNLNKYLWYNESAWAAEINLFNVFPYEHHYIPHMPGSLIFYKLFTSIFGLSTMSMRLVPIIFSISIFFLIYQFAKKYFNKDIALLSCFVYTVSFYAFISSIQVDMDGAILSFFISLTMFIFYDTSKIEKSFFPGMFVLGILLTLITCIREISGIIILFILFLYYVFDAIMNNKNILNVINFFIQSGMVFLILFCSVLIYLYRNVPNLITKIFSFMTSINTEKSLINIMLVIYALMFIGILLIPLFFINYKKKKNLFFILWIGIFFVIFLGLINIGDIARYLMPIIPAFCILFGIFMYDLQEKNYLSDNILISSFTIMFIVLFIGNMIMSFNPPNNALMMLNKILLFDFNFKFLMTNSSMLPLYISFYSILIVISIICFCYILYLISKKIQIKKTAINILLGCMFAYEIFLMYEFTTNLTQPNFSKIGFEMVDYYNNNLDENYFLNIDSPNYDPSLFYLNKNKSSIHILSPFNDFTTNDVYLKDFNLSSSYVFFMNYLNLPDEIISLENCTILKTFSDKNMVLGYIYKC